MFVERERVLSLELCMTWNEPLVLALSRRVRPDWHWQHQQELCDSDVMIFLQLNKFHTETPPTPSFPPEIFPKSLS